MSTKSSRHSISAPKTRRRPAKFARLHCEQFEDRITPALFNVQAPLSFNGLNNNGSVATADFNHDGLSDAVLTNFGTAYGTTAASGAGSTITVLYAKQGGGFSPVTLNTGGTNPSFVATGDLNGDGAPDVVVANENGQNTGSFSVFKNDGAGNLSLVGTYSTFSNDPSWIGIADISGDGVPDVIVGSFGVADSAGDNVTGNNITIFQQNVGTNGKGNLTFNPSPITTLAPDISFTPTALAIADFNGDGIMDIAAAVPGVAADVGDPQPDGSVWVFQGTGSGGFAAPNEYDTGGVLPLNIQAADLNGDGKPDLVVANAGDPTASPEFSGNSIGVLLNVSSGGSVNFGITNSLTTNCHGTFAVAVADFNLDGKPDIAAVNYGSQLSSQPAAFVSIYLGNGSGSFTPASPGTYDTGTNLGGGQYLAVGDFDGNGTPDLIVAHASNLVGLLLNTSTPQATTTTALTSSLNPSNAGQSVTLTATVTAASGSAAGGTVSFFDNGVLIGSPVSLANQQAALTITTLPVGTDPITATYSGATGFGTSTSAALSQVVNNVAPVSTTTTLSSSVNPSNAGQSVTLTATVTAASGSASGGTVTFFDNGVQIGSPISLASQQAALTTSTLAVGTQSITATYSGASGFSGSTSSALSQVVNSAAPVSTTTTLSSSINPSSFGQSVTFTATVTAASGSASGGTVTFFDNGTQIGNPVSLASQQATLTTTTLAVGTQSITATYSGATGFNGSTSSALSQVVNSTTAVSTTTALSSSANPSTFGQSVTFTATVTAATGTASGGTVTFFENGVQIGNPVSLASQQAALTVSNLPVGTQTITATYSGASGFAGSNSSTLNQVVNSPAPVSTTTALASSVNPSVFGQSVTFTATVTAAAGNASGGTVTFFENNVQIGNPVSLASQQAAFTISNLAIGTQSITATYSGAAGFTGSTSSGLSQVVNPVSAQTFSFSSIPTSATAGSPISFTLTAKGQNGSTATGYTGTVHFVSTDAAAVLPANYTFTVADNGSHTFSIAATLKTAGNQTITATDTSTTSITGTSSAIAVSSAAASHFVVSAGASASAGTSFSFSVNALDQFNNAVTGYSGLVHFSSSDGQAVLPANTTLTNGTGTFTATLKTVGNQTITATDTVTSSITGISGAITVSPAAASHFVVSAVASASAGTPFSFTVTALDQFNNTVTGYTGTVHFTSSDGQALLPVNSSLTNGIGTFSATLKTAGNQTITATDVVTSSITGKSSTIAVSPGVASQLAVSAVASATAGTAFSFTVKAQDQFNNPVTSYSGTVHFTSSDGQAVLPANASLTNGTGTFSATLKTAGSQTITATDTVTSSITGTSSAIVVSPGTVTQLLVSTPATAVAGTAFSFTVKALDQFNNTVTSFSAKVHFSSTDAQAVLPANSSLANGVGTYSATLKTAGNQTITVTDTSGTGIGGTLTGTSSTIAVSPGAVTTLTFTQQPTSHASGVVIQPSVSVSLFDSYSNPVTSGSYQVTVSLSGAAATTTLSGTTSVMSSNGVAVFSNLVVNGPGIGLTLQASASGTQVTSSAAFNSILVSNILPVVVSPDIYGPHPNTSAQEAYIKGIYNTVLGRNADPTGLSYWISQFNAGVSHLTLVNSFWNSPENRTREVNTYYQTYLGRAADPQGLSYWVQQLTNGVDETSIVFSFLLSAEELQATNTVFIQRLYEGALSRAAGTSDISYWTGQLQNGVTRQQVAEDLVFSAEAAGVAVDSDYGAYLGRAADATGRANWVAEISSQKATYASVAISLLASDEFFANAGKNVP